MNKATAKALIIVGLTFLTGLYFYNLVPDMMASHWDFRGNVNGYMSKFWGLFLMPIISFVIFLLLVFIPKLDPLKANVDKFRKYFEGFIMLILIFLFYIYVITLLWNLDYKFDMTRLMIPAIAILLYYFGVMMAHSKRNWFIGIRTPWTLSSDVVWDKTHKRGAILMKITAVLSLVGFFWPDYLLYFFFTPLMFTVFYTMIYSYLEYKKIAK